MSRINSGLVMVLSVLLSPVTACSSGSEIEKAESDQTTSKRSLSNDQTADKKQIRAKEKSQILLADMSKITGKKDVSFKGKPSCKIDFVYGGFEREDLLWDGESCEDITAKLLDRDDLKKLGKWELLGDFEKKHVEALPGGMVLYVEGAFTASLYPVGTTRLSYEVSVAD